MSCRHGSAFGWPLWCALLLMIPIAFFVGALGGHTPTWGFLKNLVVLLGSLGVAAVGNLWSLVHAGVPKGKPPTLGIEIGANPLSIIVLAVAGWIRIRRTFHAEIGL